MAFQTDPVDGTDSQVPGIADVMAAFTVCQIALTCKIDAVQLCKIQSRLTTAEQRISQAEDISANHTTALHFLQTKLSTLEYRAEDTENRKRKNGLRIVGLAEGVRG